MINLVQVLLPRKSRSWGSRSWSHGRWRLSRSTGCKTWTGVSGILIWWHSFLLLTQLISFSPETTRTFFLVCWVLASLGSGNRQGMVGIFAMTIDLSHSLVKISLCSADPEANSGHLMPLKAYLEPTRRGASYLETRPNHKLYRIITNSWISSKERTSQCMGAIRNNSFTFGKYSR